MAYTDPEVIAVLNLYGDASDGEFCHVASVVPMDPPNHLLEGLRFYRNALNRARANSMRRMNEEAKKRKPLSR